MSNKKSLQNYTHTHTHTHTWRLYMIENFRLSHTHTHTHKQTNTYTRTMACTHVRVHTHACTHTCTHVHTHRHACTHTHTHADLHSTKCHNKLYNWNFIFTYFKNIIIVLKAWQHKLNSVFLTTVDKAEGRQPMLYIFSIIVYVWLFIIKYVHIYHNTALRTGNTESTYTNV